MVAPTIWKMIVTVPGVAVIARNSQRDTLAFRVGTQNDELTRLCLLGNCRCLDDHLVTVGFSGVFSIILYIFDPFPEGIRHTAANSPGFS